MPGRGNVFVSEPIIYVDSDIPFLHIASVGEYLECCGTKCICMCSAHCIIDSIIHVGIIDF